MCPPRRATKARHSLTPKSPATHGGPTDRDRHQFPVSVADFEGFSELSGPEDRPRTVALRRSQIAVAWAASGIVCFKIRPNGCHVLGPERPEAVLPDRALYLQTFSHLLIVNKLLSRACASALFLSFWSLMVRASAQTFDTFPNVDLTHS